MYADLLTLEKYIMDPLEAASFVHSVEGAYLCDPKRLEDIARITLGSSELWQMWLFF